jgi:hypothetical protein
MSEIRVGFGVDGVDKVVNGVNRTEDALKRFRTATSQSTASLTNFSRVIQDAPYGFIGVANNLNPLLESFQRLKETTGSSKEAFKALGASMMGPGGIGIILGTVSSLLVLFGDRLFGAKAKAEESKAALDELNKTLKEQKQRVDDLASSLDFLNAINAIGIEINFGDDKGGLGLKGQLVSGGSLLYQIEQERNGIREQLSKRGQELVDGTISQKRYNEETKALNEQLGEIDKRYTETLDSQVKLRAQLRLHQTRQQRKDAEESKRLLDEERRKWEQYVKEVIARGKELAKFFESKGNRKTELFSLFDTQDEQFQKALRVIADFEGTAPIPVRLKISPEFEVVGLSDKIASAIKDNPLVIGDTDKAAQGSPGKGFFDAMKRNQAAIRGVREEMELLIQAGQFVGGALADAFSSVFDAIAEGQNAFHALGQAIKALVLDLAKAVIQSIILSVVTNAFLPGAGSAAGGRIGSLIGGLPRRAAGGPVSSRPYLVGERGPEIFIPSSSGRIAPNGQLGGLAGMANQNISIGGEVIIDGQKLRLVLARTDKKNGRY